MTSRPAGSRQGFGNRRGSAARVAADWLCLAATPTFAIMALLTGVLGGGQPDLLCAAAHDASPLRGIIQMYWLRGVAPRVFEDTATCTTRKGGEVESSCEQKLDASEQVTRMKRSEMRHLDIHKDEA